jgi:hypothetical protein
MDLFAPILASWERCLQRFALERNYSVLNESSTPPIVWRL